MLIVFPALKAAELRAYVMPVLLVALAAYVIVDVPWHRLLLEPKEKTGVETAPLVVTVCVATSGPLQPAALAVMVDNPDHPEVKVTAPVTELIIFPAFLLVKSRE